MASHCLNHLCDQLGMDTITAGNLCALTIEACRRGAVDFVIDYGAADRIAMLIEMIGRREGIGHILADGVLAASLSWGARTWPCMSKAWNRPDTIRGCSRAWA